MQLGTYHLLLPLCRLLLCLSCLAVWSPPSAAAQDPAEHTGKLVTKISFLSWINLSYEDLIAGIPLRTGEPLDQRKLGESVAALYRREIFELVEPQIREVEGGVEIELVLTPRLFLADIRFNGNDTITSEKLRRFAGVRPGQALDVSTLEEARNRLLMKYREYAHPDAEIGLRLEDSAIEPRVTAIFEIDEGHRSKISAVRIIGQLPDDVASVVDVLQQRALDIPATKATIQRLRRELLVLLRREGYLQASVAVQSQYQPLSGDTELSFEVKARDPLSLVFVGNTVFSPEELLEPLKMDRRKVPFSPNAIRSLCRDIEELYARSGYYFATVEYRELEQVGSRRMYEIRIEEGERYRVQSVRIEGNASVADSRIKELMRTTTAGFWLLKRFQPGYLLRSQLAADEAAIVEYYEDRGYFGTKVRSQVIPDSTDNSLAVTVFIDEAPQTLIKNVTMRWQSMVQRVGSVEKGSSVILLTDPLSIRTVLFPGDPFDIDKLQEERDRLFREILEQGFPRAAVELEADRTTGEVEFRVNPGPQVRVGRVWLQGNSYTHDEVLEQELEMVSGDFWRVSEMQATQRNLFGLGFFSNADVGPLDGVLDEPVEDVGVSVFERETGSVDLGASFTTEDGLHLTAELAQRNLFGNGGGLILGLDAYLKTAESLLDAGTARLAYVRPHVLGSEVDMSVEGFTQTAVEIFDQFSYDRIGASLLFRIPVSSGIKGSLGITDYQERLYDVRDDVIIDDHDFGTTFYGLAVSSLDLDARDDPYNPRRGFRTLVDARLSTTALGSEVEFIGLSVQQSLFAPISRRLVWANKIHGAVVEPYGKTEVIPIGQRLFLGGRSSLRGFSRNQVGPRGEDSNVLGGDASLNLSTELRYDLDEKLVGVMFLDVGQAFLRHEGDFEGDPHSIEDLRFSPGFGLHYKTPIGPIIGELGFALDREFGERFGRFTFAVGSAF